MNFLSFPSLHLISLFAPTHKIQKSLHFTSLVITFISSRIKPWKYGKRVCFSEFHFHIRKLVRDKLKNPVFGVRKIILSSNMTHGIILKNFEVFCLLFNLLYHVLLILNDEFFAEFFVLLTRAWLKRLQNSTSQFSLLKEWKTS